MFSFLLTVAHLIRQQDLERRYFSRTQVRHYGRIRDHCIFRILNSALRNNAIRKVKSVKKVLQTFSNWLYYHSTYILHFYNLISRDGFGSDTHENGFEYHYLPYFNPNTDTNTNIIGYEYKTDSSNSDLHSDTYLI
jgi:hypothetical protein